jgi:hypothetical protein
MGTNARQRWAFSETIYGLAVYLHISTNCWTVTQCMFLQRLTKYFYDVCYQGSYIVHDMPHYSAQLRVVLLAETRLTRWTRQRQRSWLAQYLKNA